jgi:hypothetical protein
MLALLTRAVLADDAARKPAPEPADAEFLEFLGSVGSEDEEWISYLSRTDVSHPTRDASKVAAAARPPPADASARPASAPNADTKQ